MTDRPHPTRRSVLAGAAAVGGAGLLAACGGSSDTASTGGVATPSSGPAAPTGNGSTQKGTVLTKAADVPVGGGAVLAADKLVVTQPEKGTFKAFSAVCTHMGCIVARVADKQIQCDCHGSRYSIVDGSVEHGPATAPLAETPVSVTGGEVIEA